MTVLDVVLMLATLLCSLVAGFLFAFAVVVMPGLRRLDDGAFIRAFQVIDRVIQNNQPLFLLVWVGSLLSLITAAVMGQWQLGGTDRAIVIVASVVSVLGVHGPTFGINVPLNNQLQRLDTASLNETAHKRARDEFEFRWNRWNAFRTACATVVTMMLLVLLLRL
jgi:uncharacterized membrane protein